MKKNCNSPRNYLCLIFLFLSLSVISQNITVTGRVTDDTNEPIAGATISVENSDKPLNTITDINGVFTLQDVSPNAKLLISYIGMESKSVSINGRKKIDIVLSEKSESLEEVVVVGYGTQSKKDITGSVSVVKTKDLLASTGSSAAQQLQGKASGVYIGTTGSPGAATMVRIRGINTVNNNGPLYVIDGVSTRNQDLSSLNPNDIESLQVLKDASSSAIYGSQAANGVILITTKKGTSSGKPVLTYDGYYGIQKTTKHYDLLNSMDRLALEWESQKNNLILNNNEFDADGNPNYPSNPQFKRGPEPTIPNYLTTTGAQGRTDLDINDYVFPTYQMVPFSDTNWWNEIDRVAPIQNHQLSISGGTDNGNYMIGLNLFDQKGTVIHSYYKRYQARINSSFKIRPWFRVGESFQYSWMKNNGLNNSHNDATPYSWTFRASPWIPPRDTKGNFAGSRIAGTGNFVNPVAQYERGKDNYYSASRIFGSVWSEIDLIKDLTFRTNFGLDYTNSYYYAMSKLDPENAEGTGSNRLSEGSSFNFRWVWTNTVTYNRRFNDAHSVNILLGTEAIKDGIGRGMSGSRTNYMLEDNVNTWTLDIGERNDMREVNSNYNGLIALFGVFGRLDYSYMDKYLLTAIVRRDGVSRFSEKFRYGTFPSLSLGWRLSQEGFMSGTRNWLDDLKIRIGYGSTGNSEIPRITNYATEFGTSSSQTNYDLSGKNTSADIGYRLMRFGNKDTKWEAIRMVNFGLDITLFNNKVSTTLEFYNKVTSDMLIEASYSALAGSEIEKPYLNYGSMRNRGFDFSVNYRDRSGDFSWDIALNLSKYKNKVIQLSTADDYVIWGRGDRFGQGETRTIKGRPMAEFYGFKIVGFYENEQDVLDSPIPYSATKESVNNNPKAYVGKYKYADVNGDGRITMDDRTVIGNPHPDLILGLNSTFRYKNWDFTMFWYSSIGNEILNNTKYLTDFPLFNGNRSTRMRDTSWKMGADNKYAKLPILDSKDSWTGKILNTYYIEDGSFLKLKNLVIGYSLPKRILEKISASNLRLYFQAENLLTLTKYTGLDPEITNKETGGGNGADISRGIDGGGWPTTLKILFGVNFTF